MPMAFQLLLVISGVESPTQATEDSIFYLKVSIITEMHFTEIVTEDDHRYPGSDTS